MHAFFIILLIANLFCEFAMTGLDLGAKPEQYFYLIAVVYAKRQSEARNILLGQ